MNKTTIMLSIIGIAIVSTIVLVIAYSAYQAAQEKGERFKTQMDEAEKIPDVDKRIEAMNKAYDELKID